MRAHTNDVNSEGRNAMRCHSTNQGFWTASTASYACPEGLKGEKMSKRTNRFGLGALAACLVGLTVLLTPALTAIAAPSEQAAPEGRVSEVVATVDFTAPSWMGLILLLILGIGAYKKKKMAARSYATLASLPLPGHRHKPPQ